MKILILLPIFIVHILIISGIIYKSAQWLKAKQYSYKNTLIVSSLIVISDILLYNSSFIIPNENVALILSLSFLFLFGYFLKKYFVLKQSKLIYLFLISFIASEIISHTLKQIF